MELQQQAKDKKYIHKSQPPNYVLVKRASLGAPMTRSQQVGKRLKQALEHNHDSE